MHFRKDIFLVFILITIIIIAGGILDIREPRINLDNNLGLSIDFNKYYENAPNDIVDELSTKTNSLDLQKKINSNGRQVAVIFVKFADTDDQNVRYDTPEEISDIKTSLENYWDAASNGEHQVTITTGGWYRLITNEGDYSFNDPYWFPENFIQDAVTAAETAGFEFLNADDNPKYSDIIIWIPIIYAGAAVVSLNPTSPFLTLDVESSSKEFAVAVLGENTVLGQELEIFTRNWARAAHGMGHCLGLVHTHEPDDSKYAMMANAFPDAHGTGKDPSGLTVYSQSIPLITGWFDKNANQNEYDGGQFTTNPVVVKPRHLDTTATQSLKIYKGSRDQYYLVEVIGNGDEDQLIGETGVLIYLVQKQSNGDKLTDKGIDLYTQGESFTSTDESIIITVEHDGTDYLISVVNNGPPIPNPDLAITSWNEEPPGRETYDIWVDNPVNGYLEDTPPGECLYNDISAGRTCTGIGDPPWIDIDQIGLPNRLYARVHNRGTALATDVRVQFTTYGMQAGMTGGYIEGVTDPVDIPVGESREVYISWDPQPWEIGSEPGEREIIAYKGCVKATILYEDDTYTDINPNNNWAQENILEVDLTPMSPTFGPKTVKFFVGNPFATTEDIYVNIIGVTEEGWSIENKSELGRFHTINSSDTKEFTVTFIPKPYVGVGAALEAEVIVAHTVRCNSSSNNNEVLLYPFGGINIRGNTRYRSDLSLEVFSEDEIIINGTLTSLDVPGDPQIGANGGTVLIKIFNKQNNSIKHYIRTINGQGKYEYIFPHCGEKIQYNVTAFYIGNDILTGTKSETVDFEAKAKDCTDVPWPPAISFLAMIAIAIFYRRIKLKKIVESLNRLHRS